MPGLHATARPYAESTPSEGGFGCTPLRSDPVDHPHSPCPTPPLTFPQDASPSSSFTSIMHSMRPRPLSAEPDAGLYDAPIWMLCCYALSQLPGQRGSLACIHATLAALLCGHVVLPWVNQLHKYLATSSLDGRGIQKHVTTGVCARVCLGEGGVGWLRVGWALGTDAWPVLGLPPILVHVLAESAPGSICGRPSTHAFPRPLPHPPLPSHALPLSLSSDAEGQREYQLHEDCIPSVLKPGWLHFKRWASLQTQSSQPGTSKQHTFSAFTLFA